MMLINAQDQSVVIDFGTASSDQCKQMIPIVKVQASANPDVKFLKVDIKTCPKTAAKYKIDSVPEFVFKKRKFEVDRYKGIETEQLRSFIARNYATYTAIDPPVSPATGGHGENGPSCR